MIIRSKNEERNYSDIIWKALLAIGLLAFFIYGLSLFLTKPAVQTVVTSGTRNETNSTPDKNANYPTRFIKNQ